MDFLKELRYGTTTVKQSTRKRKLNLIAGRSVGDGTEGKNSRDYDETEDYVDSEDGDVKNKKRKEANIENVIDQNEKNTEETLKDYVDSEDGDFKNKKRKEASKDCENYDIKSMPIVYDDEFEIENEYSLGLPMCDEDNKERFGHLNTSSQVLADITIGNIEKEEKQNKKINFISIKTFSKEIHVNKCKNISKSFYITKQKHVIDDEAKPSTSGIKSIPSRRTSYYKNENDILKDLMDENMQ
ncbi:unnamed protein product [Parnassius apollo]|uniref:(apollo) hypothetical protein n=1 Tax=Parnassius apollo TaxID=110799 RepID=A0A8S3X354_PARAO|nr:unnamed protein product [Parnassius apollo]